MVSRPYPVIAGLSHMTEQSSIKGHVKGIQVPLTIDVFLWLNILSLFLHVFILLIWLFTIFMSKKELLDCQKHANLSFCNTSGPLVWLRNGHFMTKCMKKQMLMCNMMKFPSSDVIKCSKNPSGRKWKHDVVFNIQIQKWTLTTPKILSRNDFFQPGINKPLRKVNVLIPEAIISNFNAF